MLPNSVLLGRFLSCFYYILRALSVSSTCIRVKAAPRQYATVSNEVATLGYASAVSLLRKYRCENKKPVMPLRNGLFSSYWILPSVLTARGSRQIAGQVAVSTQAHQTTRFASFPMQTQLSSRLLLAYFLTYCEVWLAQAAGYLE